MQVESWTRGVTGTADRPLSSERRDGMREGRGGVGKCGASLELTAKFKEISSHSATLEFTVRQ